MTPITRVRASFCLLPPRLPWRIFTFLSTALFFAYHDLSEANRNAHNYSLPTHQLANNVYGSPVHHIAYIFMGLGATVLLVRGRSCRPAGGWGSLGWLLLSFVAWAFLSLIWAQDLPLTLQRLTGFGILCITAVAVVRTLSLRRIIQWTFFSACLFVTIGLCAELMFGTFRPSAPGYRFAGSLHPNLQGIQCGLLLLSAVAAGHQAKVRRGLVWACAGLAIPLLLLTWSRTALAATFLALLVYLWAVSSPRSRFLIAATLVVLASYIGVVMWSGVLTLPTTTSSHGREQPLSEDTLLYRVEIWRDVAPFVYQRPILGYGYDAFWTPPHIRLISSDEGWGVPNGHSTYLDYWLSLGAVGLVGYVLVLTIAFARALRLYKITHSVPFAFCAALLVFCMVDGLLESSVIEGSFLKFLCMVVVVHLAFLHPGDAVR